MKKVKFRSPSNGFEQHDSKSRESKLPGRHTRVLTADPLKCRTFHDLTRSGPRNGPFFFGTRKKVEIASWDKEQTRLQKKLAEKAGSSTFRPRTHTTSSSSPKLEQNSKKKKKTCVVRSRPCVPMEGARGTYSFADFLPLKETWTYADKQVKAQ